MRRVFKKTVLQVSLLLIALFSVSAAAVGDLHTLQPAALDYTGTYAITDADPNLTGEGIVVAAICSSMTYRGKNNIPQNDYRFNMDHDSLYQADVAFEDRSDGRFSVSSHATAVAGILFGSDDSATHPDIGDFSYRGACPQAAVDVYEFRRFQKILFNKEPFIADIITLSLGEGYEDWWTRRLDNLALTKDSIVIGSIGNGQRAFDYDILYPGAGANAIGVGVINSAVGENGPALDDFSTANASDSSTGPTDNNRCKPDIVAPGTALVPMHTSDTDYTIVENWSSLAAPVVSGTTALLLQKAYTDPLISTPFDKPGKNLVIKAILLNSAVKLPYWHKGGIGTSDDTATPLDYRQGAGALDAERALAQLTDPASWDNRVLSNRKSSFDYEIDDAEPNQMLTATLCWNRFYKNDYPFSHDLDKDTDLRLELWGKLANEPNDILLDFSDSINDNVEHIYFQCIKDIETYRLRVTFNDQQAVTDKTRQRFALAYRVGTDTAAANKWWYDINGDDKIDSIDHLAYQMIKYKITNQLDEVFAREALGLTTNRIALLESNWATWKTYLTDYQTPTTN